MTRWLRYWARIVRLGGCRFVWAAGVRGSLGTGRDRRVATLPYFDFTVSRAINQSGYVLRDLSALRFSRPENLHGERDYPADARAPGSGSPPGISP